MIISLSGLIGSGKDTVANILVEHYGFRRESWANSLKDAVSAIFGWDREMLEGSTDESRIWRNQVDIWWTNRLGFQVTPREILQKFGTDICRNYFHNDIWVASLEKKLISTVDDIVISDTRFENEFNAIKRIGGYTWRIIRGLEPEWVDVYKSLNCNVSFNDLYPGIHASEYSSVEFEYDTVIENNGTIADLHTKLYTLVQNYKKHKGAV